MSTTDGNAALAAEGLGKRHKRGWALEDCTFELPRGRVSALVGPNGAGKSTLMALARFYCHPPPDRSRSSAGRRAGGSHPRLAFLAQDKPLYRRFTVEDMLPARAAPSTTNGTRPTPGASSHAAGVRWRPGSPRSPEASAPASPSRWRWAGGPN